MTDWHIHTGDCIEVLRAMPAESVHVCVTSPPYYSLRDYNVPGQIGLEQSPAEFVRKMVEVFEEVKRVMRHDATLWLNLGDTYATGSGGSGTNSPLQRGSKGTMIAPRPPTRTEGLKPKDLMLMPARVALALQEAGWWVRSDIIWCKRAPMPESVTDRPTSAHEHVFLLSKSERYFYDADAVREVVSPTASYGGTYQKQGKIDASRNDAASLNYAGKTIEMAPDGRRNLWNYWLLSPEPYPESHFATFPTEIPRRAILAGTSEHGVCGECGAPWKRVVEKERTPTRPGLVSATDATKDHFIAKGSGGNTELRYRTLTTTSTLGWQPTCRHASAPVVPATVLDCFSGAGTTIMTALRLGRRGVGIELNPQYVEMSKRRIINDAPLWNTPMEAIA